jgi:glycogen(starch) synthase
MTSVALKILISSHAFAPSIGGIETVSRLLAAEFKNLGHDVRVITDTAAETAEPLPYPVIRRAPLTRLVELIRWSDIFWQNNLSLRTIWPALLLRKPVVVTHQGSYSVQPRGLDPLVRLKQTIANHVASIAISEAVARHFAPPLTVIGNPYDARVFTRGTPRAELSELVFVGRLVSEKGLNLLLEALAVLRSRGVAPRLTVVGAGPMLDPACELVRERALQGQVFFAGSKNPAEIATILQQHRILVVPSLYDEPFGVVALEGIACGCAVIGSRGGGLAEAIGPCGITFENSDVNALAAAIDRLLGDRDLQQKLLENAPAHLARFHPARVAQSYIEVFHNVLRK